MTTSLPATSIRTKYSHHILRAHLEGFTPLSLPQFVALVAPISFNSAR